MSHARETTSAVVVFQLPPLNEFLSQIHEYVVLKYFVNIRTSRHVVFKCTLTLSIMYLSPLMPKSCAGHNSHTV